MRRKDREITSIELIHEIIAKAKVCRLALSLDNCPYIVPLNFGVKENCLFFHSAKRGKKIDILKKNDNVCFEIDIEQGIVEAEKPCEFGTKYFSVIGSGKAILVNDASQKKEALDIIMKHYTNKENHEYDEAFLKRIVIIKIEIEQMTGKKSE